MRGPPDHRTATGTLLQFFLHCSFFCTAIVFALQFLLALQFFLRCSFFCVVLVSWAFSAKGWGGLGEVRGG